MECNEEKKKKGGDRGKFCLGSYVFTLSMQFVFRPSCQMLYLKITT